MADAFLIQHLGMLLLIQIQMDSYYKSQQSKRINSLDNYLVGFDTGTKIVNKVTEYIDKSLFPEWIYVKSIDDIINLAFNFKDVDFLCDILTAISRSGEELTLSASNVNNLLNLLKSKNSNRAKRGAPTHSIFHRDITYSKISIIAGILSTGRKKIKGIKTLIDVQDTTASILGISSAIVKKNCYEKKYNEDGVKIRLYAEHIASRIFSKLNNTSTVPIPTPIECYMVLFEALFHVKSIWTGHYSEDGIPELKLV